MDLELGVDRSHDLECDAHHDEEAGAAVEAGGDVPDLGGVLDELGEDGDEGEEGDSQN